jgi:hypothetical protein
MEAGCRPVPGQRHPAQKKSAVRGKSIYFAPAILFGVGVGNQGGAAGSMPTLLMGFAASESSF